MSWIVGLEEVTDEQIAIALANELDKHLVYSRIYHHGYPVEKAITEPRQKRFGNKNTYEVTPEDIAHAAVYGVPEKTLRGRLYKGDDKSSAMTRPFRKNTVQDYEIISLREQGYSYRAISEKLGVSKSKAHYVVNGG